MYLGTGVFETFSVTLIIVSNHRRVTDKLNVFLTVHHSISV
jgi:hypothetical protein